LDEESTFRVTVKHDYNEHNRLWNNPWRETLACRGNRACDFAVRVASKKWWRNYDYRTKPQRGHGGVITFTCDSILIDGDIKEVIMEKLGAGFTAYLRTAPIEGRTARAAEKGREDVKATQEAWKLPDGEETGCLVRNLMGRHATNMSQLFLSAKRRWRENPVQHASGLWRETGTMPVLPQPRRGSIAQGIHEPTAITNACTRQAQVHGSAWALS